MRRKGEHEEFQVVYTGPALRRGMPVEMFCESITALEAVLQESKRILDPNAPALTVKVGKITTKGDDFKVGIHLEMGDDEVSPT